MITDRPNIELSVDYMFSSESENETSEMLSSLFDFDLPAVAQKVCAQALSYEGCTYDCEISLLITDSEHIRELNRDYRGIDNPTDVLSFPNVDFEVPSDFSAVEENEADYVDPDSDYLMLGDIVINVDRVVEQALSYGHSRKREFAFLIAHSMLHLCGYDHMTEEEASVMEKRQEAILQKLGIVRE